MMILLKLRQTESCQGNAALSLYLVNQTLTDIQFCLLITDIVGALNTLQAPTPPQHCPTTPSAKLRQSSLGARQVSENHE